MGGKCRPIRLLCGAVIDLIIINNNNNNNNNNASAYGFLAGLGQKISAISGDDGETCYLFQRISVLIQLFNATLLHESFADENRSDD